MPDEMYVVCLENNCCKDFTRTLRCCRLLNKVKGMKPTRELCLRRRSQTGARKSLTGPTPEKDNAVNPAQHFYICGPSSGIRTCRHHDIWRSFVRDESRTHYICEPSYRIRSCRRRLELMSCGVERCSRGLETTGRPTNRRSSVGGSSQGRIRAKVVFALTECSFARKGACQCQRYASSQLEKPSTVLAECSLGRRTFQGYAYGRLLRRLRRSGWCIREVTVVELSVYRVGRSFVSLWNFWTALETTQAMELGGCPTLSEDDGCDGERIRSVILLVM